MLKLDGSWYVVQDSSHHAWHDFDFKYYKCVLNLWWDLVYKKIHFPCGWLARFSTACCFGRQVWRSWSITAHKRECQLFRWACMSCCHHQCRETEIKSDSQRLVLHPTLLCACVCVCVCVCVCHVCVLVICVRFWVGATMWSHLTVTCHWQQMFTQWDYLLNNQSLCVCLCVCVCVGENDLLI